MSKKWPPLDSGTRVITTQPDLSEWHQWTAEGLKAKRWNDKGVIIGHSDAHGLCYEVRHSNGSKAYYGPKEFRVMVIDESLEILRYRVRQMKASQGCVLVANGFAEAQEFSDEIKTLEDQIAAIEAVFQT